MGAMATSVGIISGGIGIAALIEGGSTFSFQYSISLAIKSGLSVYGSVTSGYKGSNIFNALGEIENGNKEYWLQYFKNSLLFYPLFKFNK